jgi:hypothetical protein
MKNNVLATFWGDFSKHFGECLRKHLVTLSAILNFTPGPQECSPLRSPPGANSIVQKNGRANREFYPQEIISPPRDNFTPKGQNSPLGDNFAPGGQSLAQGVKLIMGLCC